jgi:RNA polymerase sigma-70 factor, ECF subfamily
LEQVLEQSIKRSPSASDAPSETLDVASLTRRMAEGDEMAYRTFYDAYFDRLWRYLLVVTSGNEDNSREALQACLVRVTRYIKVFQQEDAFWSWLTVLARSALKDESRKRRRYFAFLDRFTWHARAEDQSRNVPDRAEERLQNLLDENVKLLAADEYQLVSLKYYESRSVRDIADELQTTEKSVESKLSRIRRKLKEAVLEKLSHEPQT